jgi:hypothetical protein
MMRKEVVVMQPRFRAHPRSGSRAGWLTPHVRVLCGVSPFQDAASELLHPILPILLTVILGAPVAGVGAVEGAAEGVVALSKIAAGRLADRGRKRPLIALGYGLAAPGVVEPIRSSSAPAGGEGS